MRWAASLPSRRSTSPGFATLDSAVVRDLPDLRVDLRIARRYLSARRRPNLVAVLEGRDPRRRHEYVAISAHLDHVGVRPGRADSIFNGADDNASGVAGLLELAEAFSRREARPARSLLFLVPSGEEKGLWGSAYWVRHPTVQLGDVVADLNMDLIGRNWVDSVIVTGPEMSTLGETLRRVTARHPELRMAPVADRWPEERIFYRSDHYNLALAGVPVLFFTSGTHADYHQPSDVLEPDRHGEGVAAGPLRLPPQPPRWRTSPSGRGGTRAATTDSWRNDEVQDRSRTRIGVPRAVPLAAQAPEPVRAGSDAAASITASDVARRVGILAHDSMMGRDTPSRGLELTAKYVADEFRRFGLEPGGDNGTWFQRYPITRRRLQPAQSRVVLKAGGTTATARLDATARHVSGDIPRQPVAGPVILVGGPVTPDAVGAMKLRDKVVLYVHDYSHDDPRRTPPRWPARSG